MAKLTKIQRNRIQRNFRKGMTAKDSISGIFMKDDEGHQQQQQTESGAEQKAGNENNTGATGENKSFWHQEEKGENNQQQQSGQKTLAQQLQESTGSFSIAPVMTQEVMAEIAEGKSDLFEASLKKNMQSVLQKSQEQQFLVLQEFGTKLFGHIEQMIEKKFGTKETSDFLETNFPSAKDPELRPFIQMTFDQAMTLHKGNKERAISATKEMLRTLAQGTAKDIGFNASQEKENSGANLDWVKLLGSK